MRGSAIPSQRSKQRLITALDRLFNPLRVYTLLLIGPLSGAEAKIVMTLSTASLFQVDGQKQNPEAANVTGINIKRKSFRSKTRMPLCPATQNTFKINSFYGGNVDRSSSSRLDTVQVLMGSKAIIALRLTVIVYSSQRLVST